MTDAEDYLRANGGDGKKWRKVLHEIAVLGRMAKAVAKGDYDLATPKIVMAVATLGYVVSPVDAIPDIVPILGLTDDAALVTATVGALTYEIACFRSWELGQEDEA